MNHKITLTQEEIEYLGITHKTHRNRYRLSDEQKVRLYDYRGLRDEQTEGIEKACANVGVSPKDVKMIWLKTKEESVRVENPYYLKPEDRTVNDILEGFLERFKGKIEIKGYNIPPLSETGLFDRLVYTDTHVGMNPNPDGYSLYGGVWNEDELMRRLQLIINHVLDNKNADTLVIDDLGDFFDGFDGKTVRREHDLPQNMDDQKAFDIGFQFKAQMLEILSKFYNKIIVNNICESNHSAAFDYIVNSALKTYAEKVFPNVEIHNHRKFINHYHILGHTFIISHGKDSKNLKFGFKPFLDAVQEQKINNYIDEHFLYQKGHTIEFSKGDSHLYIFDNSSSDRFNYYNYPALSPSSSWVQTNFRKGKSGIIFFNYKENGKEIKELFFKWDSKSI